MQHIRASDEYDDGWEDGFEAAFCMLTALVFLSPVLRLIGQWSWPERIILPVEERRRRAA